VIFAANFLNAMTFSVIYSIFSTLTMELILVYQFLAACEGNTTSDLSRNLIYLSAEG
jgi:hypothetical protein